MKDNDALTRGPAGNLVLRWPTFLYRLLGFEGKATQASAADVVAPHGCDPTWNSIPRGIILYVLPLFSVGHGIHLGMLDGTAWILPAIYAAIIPPWCIFRRQLGLWGFQSVLGRDCFPLTVIAIHVGVWVHASHLFAGHPIAVVLSFACCMSVYDGLLCYFRLINFYCFPNFVVPKYDRLYLAFIFLLYWTILGSAFAIAGALIGEGIADAIVGSLVVIFLAGLAFTLFQRFFLERRVFEMTGVAIVGGGWVGLLVARLLRQFGVPVVGFEKSTSWDDNEQRNDVESQFRLGCFVDRIEEDNGRWSVIVLDHGAEQEFTFDAVVICTGKEMHGEYLGRADRFYKQSFSVENPTFARVGNGPSDRRVDSWVTALQARWVANVLAGRMPLPGKRQMDVTENLDRKDAMTRIRNPSESGGMAHIYHYLRQLAGFLRAEIIWFRLLWGSPNSFLGSLGAPSMFGKFTQRTDVHEQKAEAREPIELERPPLNDVSVLIGSSRILWSIALLVIVFLPLGFLSLAGWFYYLGTCGLLYFLVLRLLSLEFSARNPQPSEDSVQ